MGKIEIKSDVVEKEISLPKNIQLHFQYRDYNGYKFATPTYVLEGSLSSIQIKNLQNLFGDAEDLLVPSQISEEFSNACPVKDDYHFKTVNATVWDEDADHCWHSIQEISYTDRPINVAIKAEDFYNKCMALCCSNL